ncbi:hypothetical protein CI610_02292 [invertebrate metagenome]|uniref:Uncharacterized protein n=1 Tax=invertebrate metagenome TaxID=1711999 RepID=A0A2H9T6C2_9ZZZZ
MPWFGISFLLSLLCVIISSAHAANLIDMAHKAGFTRCDNAIAMEFKAIADSPESVASTGHFNNRNFSIMATWEENENSFWKNTTLIKFGRSCMAFSVTGTTETKSCQQFLSANKQWQTVKTQKNFIWIKNDTGTSALLRTLSDSLCSITYRTHHTYDSKPSTIRTQKDTQHSEKSILTSG